MSKIKVGVIFGGQSSEHEISCVSAATVIKNINPDKYETVLVGITVDGRWLKVGSVEDIENKSWINGTASMILSPDRSCGGFVLLEDGRCRNISVDVVFPVLHGLYGEDGTIQGILELSGIPYVGCGVVASAVCMDKLFTKIIVDSIGGIRQARYTPIRRQELKDMADCIERIESVHKYPVFVKPSNAGSSKGVSRAKTRAELEKGLVLAAAHDEKILVEEAIIGREMECAVLGGLNPEASAVGEIIAAGNANFYDYDSKYNNSESKTDIKPMLPQGVEEEIRRDAVAIYKAVDGFGLARVDFFLENDSHEVVFNEINTMPGFTSISMYPMLWEAEGIDKEMLIDRLIQNSFYRHR